MHGEVISLFPLTHAVVSSFPVQTFIKAYITFGKLQCSGSGKGVVIRNKIHLVELLHVVEFKVRKLPCSVSMLRFTCVRN